MLGRQVITAAAVVAIGVAAAAAQTTHHPSKPAKQPAQPVATATARPASADRANPLDPTVGVGGLQFKRQEFDTGLKSGTRYQTDLTRRKDLYLYGGSSTPGERPAGGVPAAPVDQSRPAGTTFGGGVGIRF